jgi:hypothetical protein
MAHQYHQGWSHGWKKSTRATGGEWYDSRWELQYMDELDRDPLVLRWTRHHGVRIPYWKRWAIRGRYEPDFLVELVDGTKELREVKGEHFLEDKNTTRKLQAGDRFCRVRGMIFRVVTKSAVDPSLWSPSGSVQVQDMPSSSRPPLREDAFKQR